MLKGLIGPMDVKHRDWLGGRPNTAWTSPAATPRASSLPTALPTSPQNSVLDDMPTPLTGLLSATREADIYIFAIGLITVMMEGGDVSAFTDESYCRYTILHTVPPTPPNIDRAMFCAMHRLHVIGTAFDLASRRGRKAVNPRFDTEDGWKRHREFLRKTLRTFVQNNLDLERYANRPVSMADEPIHTTLYGGTVTRLRSGVPAVQVEDAAMNGGDSD
ncbi:hypothetical protein DFP72DRAFT_851587 [Ephemerocybe angulata]|uniref:Uncharacterized protein n=1 Tax=Ephemerocybe angulata TaxID=980116 RepID=A0A8H6M043_9AGAR|nr:hypothetical protein DFP72DRAFT_851587 [Tulosesus angulatus]